MSDTTTEEKLADAQRRASELEAKLQSTKILLLDVERQLALATAERDATKVRLQDLRALLAKRPAGPAGLLEAYMRWSGEVHAFESRNIMDTAADPSRETQP